MTTYTAPETTTIWAELRKRVPDDWEVHRSKRYEQFYFFNGRTGKTCWRLEECSEAEGNEEFNRSEIEAMPLGADVERDFKSTADSSWWGTTTYAYDQVGLSPS
eukprot:SAG11_NODE_20021_length_454_cov_1.016901_1_plen_103_part_10